MNIFLKAKHWQLFLLTFGIPVILQIVMIVTLISGIMNKQNSMTFLNALWIFPIIMLFTVGALFGWFWAVVIGLQKKLPQDLQMKVTLFKIFFFIPLIYILALTVCIPLLFVGSINHLKDPSPLIIGFSIIIPLHLFSMFCIFYNLYFVAKTIKTVELQREATFGEFVGEFFLIWFFFVGVWILQPHINNFLQPKEVSF